MKKSLLSLLLILLFLIGGIGSYQAPALASSLGNMAVTAISHTPKPLVKKIVKPSKVVVPAGASAVCGDRTYSFSASRRGTCSHHGGVREWLD
jgi:hypothetical protein